MNDGCLFLRAYIGIGLIKFRVACHRHQFRRCAQTHDVIGIDIRLHGKLSHRANHIRQQAVQVLVLLDAAVAYASVYHHNGNVHLPRRLEEIRPKFRFHRQEHPGMNPSQHPAGQKRQIQREIDDGIGIFDNAVSHLITAGSNHRNKNRRLGKFLMKFFNQRTGGHDFAHRGCMYPDTVFFGYLVQRVLRENAQALADTFHKAFFPDGTNHKHRYYQDDNDYRRYIVEKLHLSMSLLKHFHF